MDEKKESLLKARAEKLARVTANEGTLAGTTDVLLFSLSGEIYGIESIYVEEVYPVKELARLPSVPDFVVGVIQVRRKVYSVLDLRTLFGIPFEKKENSPKTIILRNEEMAFGLLTEEVLEIRAIRTEELQPPLPSMHGVYLEFIKGITWDRVVILDGHKLLSASTLVVS